MIITAVSSAHTFPQTLIRNLGLHGGIVITERVFFFAPLLWKIGYDEHTANTPVQGVAIK